MLQTRKTDIKDVVAVAWVPTEINLRKSGRANFNKERTLVCLEGDKLIIDKNVAKDFGFEIFYKGE